MDFRTLSTYNDLANAFVYIATRISHLRDGLPYPSNDARHVALGRMQRIVAGYGMGLNSMIFNRTQEQVIESLGTTNLPPDEMRRFVEDAWRWGVGTLLHFGIDSLFSNLLVAAGQPQSPQFRQKAEALIRENALSERRPEVLSVTSTEGGGLPCTPAAKPRREHESTTIPSIV